MDTTIVTTPMSESPTSVITRLITNFNSAREKLSESAADLYSAREKRLWEGMYSSWGEFIEDGLKISQGFASKLCAVYEHYVLSGGLPIERMTDIDTEKAYMAMRLQGSPIDQISKATTLTRRMLKEQRVEDTGHVCTPMTICSACHKRL